MPWEDIVERVWEFSGGGGVWHHVAGARFMVKQRMIETALIINIQSAVPSVLWDEERCLLLNGWNFEHVLLSCQFYHYRIPHIL